MRCLIAISLAVCLAGVHSAFIEGDNIRDSCIQSSGVDTNLFKQMDETNTYIPDRKVGCYVACVMKLDGIMSKDGVINTESSKYPPEPTLKECGKLRGDDACDTASKVVECVLKARAAGLLQ